MTVSLFRFILSSFLAFSVFCSFLFASSGEEDSLDQPSSLHRTLEDLSDRIDRTRAKVRSQKLLELHKQFKALSYPSEQWKAQAQQRSLEKWPTQSWKESIGSHLFYPPDVSHHLSCRSTQHLLHRREVIWSFAVAARYHDPVAQYHLASILDEVCSHYGSSRPKVVTELYHHALDILEKCSHHPQACHILGLNSSCHASKVGLRAFDLQGSLELFAKGAEHPGEGGYQNAFAHLRRREVYRQFKSPDKKDYLALEDYGPAYVQAAHLSKRFKSKKKYLEQAVQKGHPQALLSLGLLYQEKEKIAEMIEAYEQGGLKGVPRGYVMISYHLIGDQLRVPASRRDLTRIPSQDLQQALTYLRKAGQAGDLEGWNQLINVYETLYNLYKNPEDLEELIEALKQGLRRGSSYAYHKARVLFPRAYEGLVTKYGPAPYEGLPDQIAQFLGEDDTE